MRGNTYEIIGIIYIVHASILKLHLTSAKHITKRYEITIRL